MWFWLSVFTALGLLWFVRYLFDRYHLFHTFDRLNIPGPRATNIFLGHLSFKDRSYYLKQFPRWFATYGDYFGYYRGDRPIIVMRRPDMVQEVFSRRFKDFPNRLRFSLDTRPFSASVLATRDGHWRQMRKTIAPAFTAMQMSKPSIRRIIFASIERLSTVLQTKSMSRIVKCKPGDDKLVVNATHLAECFTLEAISKIAFALNNTDLLERDDSHLMVLMEEFMSSIDNPVVKSVHVVPFLKPALEFIGNYLTSGRIIDLLVEHLRNKIEDYQQRHDANDSERSILMEYILQRASQGDLSQEEAIGNLMVILMAGYETTAVCLSFTLFVLAQHQHIQKQLREELIKFFLETDMTEPDAYRTFYRQNVGQEPVEIRVEILDRIIFESLRLYPPVTDFVTREISDSLKEVRLESQPDIVVSRDVAIQIPIWSIHHDPVHWPNPFTFDIDRPDLPIPGAKSEDKNPLFVAFGLGQRSCIGGNLALAELRHLLAALVLNYDIQLLEADGDFEGYDLDENGMLRIEGNAELIKPSKQIQLQFIYRK